MGKIKNLKIFNFTPTIKTKSLDFVFIEHYDKRAILFFLLISEFNIFAPQKKQIIYIIL